MSKAILHHVSLNWLKFIESEELNGEINFWTKPKNISPKTGELFFVKERNKVLGCGEVVRTEQLTLFEAWSSYGFRNGCQSLDAFIKEIKTSRIPYVTISEETVVLCIILKDFLVFDPIPFDQVGLKPIRNFEYLDDTQIKVIQKQIVSNSEKNGAEKNRIHKSAKLSEHLVKSRLFQQYFRNQVLDLFSHKCIICGCDMDDLLEAAHIIEVHNDLENAADLNNGLCFCRNHHKMFDSRILVITQELRVKMNWKAGRNSIFQENESERFDGKFLDVIRDESKNYISQRNKII